MLCEKCGEPIPDGSLNCPECGAFLARGYVAPKPKPVVEEADETVETHVVNYLKPNCYIWCIFALLSFVFLAFNYLTVSVGYSYLSSDSTYSGYGLLKCLNGSVATSGYMVIIMIITNIAVLLTGIIGANAYSLNTGLYRILVIAESAAYLIASFVTFFNIKKVLGEFNSVLSDTKIGIGCYLHMILAVAAIVYYFAGFHRQLYE